MYSNLCFERNGLRATKKANNRQRITLMCKSGGERVRGFDVNTLTVIANEGYESFAENLQKESNKIPAYALG
jgi:type III restriction enzyme